MFAFIALLNPGSCTGLQLIADSGWPDKIIVILTVVDGEMDNRIMPVKTVMQMPRIIVLTIFVTFFAFVLIFRSPFV